MEEILYSDFVLEYVPKDIDNSFEFPKDVRYIGAEAFKDCTKLSSIEIPNWISTIRRSAFSSCVGLTNIDFPRSVKEIGRAAFSECMGLTNIFIPNTVSVIGKSYHRSFRTSNHRENPFARCPNIDTIEVEGSNPYYNSKNHCNAIIETTTNKLISGCKNTIIPQSVRTIEDSAFEGCTELISIKIPNLVTTIEHSAFERCM